MAVKVVNFPQSHPHPKKLPIYMYSPKLILSPKKPKKRDFSQKTGYWRTVGNVRDKLGNVRRTLGNVHEKAGNVRRTLGNVRCKVGNVRRTLGNKRDKVGKEHDKVGNVR